MRIGTLVRNEWIKTTRRFAFWITLISFAGITAIGFGEQWWSALKNPRVDFGFPDAWAFITGDYTIVATIFAAIVLTMLLGGEYSYRTARQNVIDGLSKEQFFAGKVFTWLGVVAAFWLVEMILGFGFALPGTADGAPFIRATDLGLVLGMVLAMLLLTSLAFFMTFLSRAAAAGIGLFFLYIAFVEDLLVSLVRLVNEDAAAAIGPHLPMNLAEQAIQTWQWDPAVLARIVEEAVSAGRTPPEPMAPLLLVGWMAGWMAVVVLGAFAIFRARDL